MPTDPSPDAADLLQGHDLFELAPVSPWLEDYSVVKGMLNELREAGVSDFRAFINVNPEFVPRCMQDIRVVEVNQQTLIPLTASDKGTLLSFAMGTATCRQGERLEATMHPADQRMYAAKKDHDEAAGINRRHTELQGPP